MKAAGMLVMGALVAMLGLAGCASTKEPAPPRPMETIEDTIEVSALVEKVDVANRLVSIKADDGKVATLKVGPEVQNLVMINPGDRIVVRYREAIGARISTTPAGGQEVTVDIDAERARLGQRPAGSASATTNVPVTINSVNTATNTVTFHGADGLVRSLTVETPQGQAFIKQLKAGDSVVVSFTEAIALSVEPAKK